MQFHSISNIGSSHMSSSIGTAIARVFHPTSRAVEKVMKSEGGVQAFINNLKSLENQARQGGMRDGLLPLNFQSHVAKLEKSSSPDLVKDALKYVRQVKQDAKSFQADHSEGKPGSSHRDTYATLHVTRELAKKIQHAPHKPQ